MFARSYDGPTVRAKYLQSRNFFEPASTECLEHGNTYEHVFLGGWGVNEVVHWDEFHDILFLFTSRLSAFKLLVTTVIWRKEY